jgi:hypothetical protein
MALAAGTLTFAGSPSMAQDTSGTSSAGSSSGATGQPTSMDEQQGAKTAAPKPAGGEASAKEITGRVLLASPSKLFLEHMGAVVEFNIAPDAQFSGGKVGSSRDLSEGQEVRASFTVENKTTNVAKRISLAREAGAPSPKR